MTAQILASELGNLIQDSKRKNSELRNAAEKALQDLKSLPVTSEAQLAAACGTHNAKFGSSGVSCLQRLSVSRALPKDRLTEVLEALRECLPLSHDIQLKILQTLPSLLQNYPLEIRGDLVSIILQICSALQTAKNFAVSNTAAATLQQLVIAIFDRVASEDERSLEIPTSAEISLDRGPLSVRPTAHDAYKVFNDLNLLVTGEKPVYIRFSSIQSTATLELIEAVLSNHNKIMTSHLEQVHILRSLLMPTIIRSLSDRLSFPVTLRILRILNLLVRNHLSTLPSECEIALGLLNHMLDPEASPLWKRALCLEIFRGIYSDSRLVLEIFGQFDEQEGKKNIFSDNLAAFVRLSTEKPAVIGLGQQSTIPSNRNDSKDTNSEQAVAEAGALAGVIGGPPPEANSNGHPVGIGMQWSSLKTPCMEHLDKTDPPPLPETYVYSLVLTCITNVSESLAKFILPLTVHHESRNRKRSKTDDVAKNDSEDTPSTTRPRGLSRAQSFRKKTIPVNPLTLLEHSAHTLVQTASDLVVECWPAVLATCSTFLNAALDTEYYRALVRAIQKFTQVAGLLRLSTPRDAFLTTLAKAAVPPSLLHANIASPKSPPADTQGVFSNPKGLLSVDSFVSQASSMSTERNWRPSYDASMPALGLGPRNLLCLRALLNLAIALGPTLQKAWSIVFETLQVADLVLAVSTQQSSTRTPSSSVGRLDAEASSEKVEAETAAVQAAARRLFESTIDYPNESFVELLQALCTLLNHVTSENGQQTPTQTSRPQILHQRRVGSVSGLSLNTETHARDSMFALNKIGELASFNDNRLTLYEPEDSGWAVLITELVRFSGNDSRPTSARLVAADILSRTVQGIARLSMTEDAVQQRNEIQTRIISALQSQVLALHQLDKNSTDSHDDAAVKIHQVTLEALKAVIEQCGDSLVAGWDTVFDTLSSIFRSSSDLFEDNQSTSSVAKEIDHPSLRVVDVIAKSLARSAFGSIELVCSDFLAVVPTESLGMLLELLLKFCSQQEDFNMSLTTITFYWNVSDFLHSRSDLSTLTDMVGNSQQLEDIRAIIKDHSQRGVTSALWLQVLINLATVTTDKRAELRNSAVQTIQRIFENYADQLSSKTWMLCIRAVIFAMVRSNLTIHKSMRNDSVATSDEIASWNDTTKSVLSSVSVLLVTYLDNTEGATGFSDAWSEILDTLREYFDHGSHALGCSVFTTITAVLSRVDNVQVLGTSALHKTAFLWEEYFNHRAAWSKSHESNQESFVAYAEAFKAMYRLSQRDLEPALPSMLSKLEACVVDSDVPAYSSDVDHMTSLQTEIIDCLSSISTDSTELATFMIKLLSRFTKLPYAITTTTAEKRVPTFVAFSKSTMTLLDTTTSKHINDDEIYLHGAFQEAMESLAKHIQEKYIWKRDGKAPALWQKATNTALAILDPGLRYLSSHEVPVINARSIWAQIVSIAGGITQARLTIDDRVPTVKQDEEFDVVSFSKLRNMMTIALGSSQVSDSLRRSYTRQLFEMSIIHEPLAGEIPDLASAPLEDLYKIRYGRTNNLEPVLRTAIAYLCFAELISLVSVHDSTTERVKLAQAAAPYLILRAALPLRAYIADHPLRGRMPTPDSQRRELLFTLNELRKLKSEPQAIPDAPGVISTHGKHLHRLYPLLVRASKAARNDAEVFGSIVALTEAVGNEFGVDED